MGKYINQTSNGMVGASFKEKTDAIMKDGGVIIPTPKQFFPNLVCIVDNGMFAAAAYCYSESEFEEFNDPTDYRPKRWLIWDKVAQYAK